MLRNQHQGQGVDQMVMVLNMREKVQHHLVYYPLKEMDNDLKVLDLHLMELVPQLKDL